MSLADLTAFEAAARLADGAIRSVELVSDCLARIEEREPAVKAWAHLDRDHALAQAEAADAARRNGMPCGPLHGLPVGIKDIFDTDDMPSEYGSPLFAGRSPNRDATAVALLRRAGAIIMGKTVTTEFAQYAPALTTNPHDAARTPGGSSSGSAAAVAAGMVPLAIGSQTHGSVVRPASFCGVVGYKPTVGRISRRGALLLSQTFDTVGAFGRSVEDVALIADALDGYDPDDPAMARRAPMRLLEGTLADPPLEPVFAFVRTPAWDKADEDARDAFAELAELLGDRCDEVPLPAPFDAVAALHRTVMSAEIARNLGALVDRGKERVHASVRDMVAEGRTVTAVDYLRALDMIEVLNAGLDEIFARYDAIITPATTGQAPVGLGSTGDPSFCTIWTLCGVPAITLPIMHGGDNMPIGVQVVGQRGHDARLLRTARRLFETVTGTEAA